MERIYPAHIRINENGEKTIQTVAEHCRATAKIASDCLSSCNLENTAYLAGLIHDLGKYTEKFSNYIQAISDGEKVERGSVNHTFAGVRMILEHYHDDPDWYHKAASELISYASGAHHGLFDCIDEDGESGFLHRINQSGIDYENAKTAFLEQCCSEKELSLRMEKAVDEIKSFISTELFRNTQSLDPQRNNKAITFYIGMLSRLLLSAVIEGDRLDTAQFMEPESKNGIDVLYSWEEILNQTEQKINQLPCETGIDQARKIMSDTCRSFASREGGIYRLNMPTGGGKTLSSLRYALAHAAEKHKSRIIFTSPLLSILDQNAGIIRNYVNNDKIILEHHSNIIRETDHKEELDTNELAMENWGSPIIITTLVQLLNTLFSGKTSCIRRFHSLCNSIIVIDEIQTIPTRMLSLFHLAINFLAKVCNTTVVLCSATQPSDEYSSYPFLMNRAACDIVPYDKDLWKVFDRTEVGKTNDTYTLEEIPSLISLALDQSQSLLVICNKKKEAAFLYNEFIQDESLHCFHLSASMCMAHRKETLKQIYTSLKNEDKTGCKTLCISTQVIEAGVHISFDSVIRLAAGLDNIIQAAGRCNRNGESAELRPVYIANCINESLGPLKEIQDEKSAFLTLRTEFKKSPTDFGRDMFSNESIQFYYRQLYKGAEQDYKTTCPRSKKNTTILSLLSVNTAFSDEYCEHYSKSLCSYLFVLNQSFKTAGNLFQVFDDESVDVIVPFGKGIEIIQEIKELNDYSSISEVRRLLDRAKPYTVSVHKNLKDQLINTGCIISVYQNSIYVLDYGYDERVGIVANPEKSFLGV